MITIIAIITIITIITVITIFTVIIIITTNIVYARIYPDGDILNNIRVEKGLSC